MAYGYGEPNNSFQAFNSQQQIAARAVLQNYSSVINVTFTEVTETSTQHGDLRFAKSGSPRYCLVLLPFHIAKRGRRLVQQLFEFVR